jgi:transposase
MNKQDARFLHPVMQRDIRQKTVEMFLSGFSKVDISTQLCVSRQSVYKWLKAYEEDGEDGISIDKRGRPKGTQIKPWQSAQIVYLIKKHNPDELSLPFFLWTRESVGLLILKKFSIKLSKWTVGRYLTNWGFSPQKPTRRAIEQDPEAIKKWFKIEYPMIQKLAKKEMATIYWGDEMGLRSDHNAGRTYGIIGKTPIVRRSGNRFSCNMISTITNLGKLSFMIFHENFTSEVFLRFLERLVQQASRKIFLIVDRHRAHKSKQVQQWLIKNEKAIRIFYLPSYCPELNPDEFLNQDVKTHLGKKRVKDKAEMIKNLNSHLKMRQKQPDIIQNFIRGCHPKYAV